MGENFSYPETLSDLAGKSYLKQIWEIAWPTSISMLLFSLYDLIDLKWIGFLGTEAVASVSLCGNINGVLFGLMNILYIGSLAVFTRFIGAGEQAKLRHSFHQSIFLGALIGLLLFVIGWLTAPLLLGFFHLSSQVYHLSLVYLRIFYIFFFFLFLGIPLWTAWIALGKTWLLLIVNLISVGFNLILDPVFIFPRGEMLVGVFGWGVAGAAIASLLSEILSLLILLGLLKRKDFMVKSPVFKNFKVSFRESLRILRIGIPSSIAVLSRPMSTVILQRFITGFGASALAGFGIGLRWLGINWIFFGGISAAVSSLVGRYLGARLGEKAGAMMRRAYLLGVVIQFLVSLFFILWAEPLVAVMEPTPETIQAGSAFLIWVSVAMLLSSPGNIARACLNGAGNTNPPMVISIISNWVVKLPLAWALAYPLKVGLSGIWQAMFVSLVVEGALLLAWYFRGRWKEHKI